MLCHLMASDGRSGFHINRDIGNAVILLKDYLKLIGDARNFFESLLNLPRIKIDALYDKHIIGAPRNTVNPKRCATAGAFFAADNPRNITRAIADDGHRLTIEGRKDNFAVFAIGNDFARFGIYDFCYVLVFPDMNSRMSFTILPSRADAASLCHAVDIKAFNAKPSLNALSRLIRESFRTENTYLEIRQIALAFRALVKLFYYARNVRDNRDKTFDAKIPHQPYLPLCISR